MLIIAGKRPYPPSAITMASFKKQRRNSSPTESLRCPTAATRWSSTVAGTRSPIAPWAS